MKLLLFIFSAFVLMPTSQGCAISPIFQITEKPLKYAQKFELIFLGRITEIEPSVGDTQIVQIEVIKLFKGEPNGQMRIVNKLRNSCSTPFGKVNSRYYIFGNQDQQTGDIVMHGFPSFVPEKIAQASAMLQQLSELNHMTD